MVGKMDEGDVGGYFKGHDPISRTEPARESNCVYGYGCNVVAQW